jgi:hypothetical protein
MWRWRLAGGFSPHHEHENRRRDASATKSVRHIEQDVIDSNSVSE